MHKVNLPSWAFRTHFKCLKIFILFHLVVGILSSCFNGNTNQGNSQQTNDTSSSGDTSNGFGKNEPKSISTKLQVLYLENHTGKPQLDTLVKKAKKKDIIVFQFRTLPNGMLSLGAWPGEEKHKDFDSTKMVRLSVLKDSGWDINGIDMFLGDMDVDVDEADLDDLVNKPEAKYLIFVPVGRVSNLGYTHLIYEIYKSADLQTWTKRTADMVAICSPSPPKYAL